MRLYRIKITSWTASFRYPNIISGYQPTLDVPPLSTVLGLINACAGYYVEYGSLSIGYYFEYKAKGKDLETIYQVEYDKGAPKKQVKSNVLNREFLYDCTLYVYLDDESIASFFKAPVFQILLGRSNDLATIEEITTNDYPLVDNASHIAGQIVPFMGNYLPGTIQALPKYFTNTIPRENIGTEPYSVISCNSLPFQTHLNAIKDEIEDKEVDIYLHHLDFEQYKK